MYPLIDEDASVNGENWVRVVSELFLFSGNWQGFQSKRDPYDSSQPAILAVNLKNCCSCLFEIWRWRGMYDSILPQSSHELGSASLCKIQRVRVYFSHGLTVIDVLVADRAFVRLQRSRLCWMFVVRSTSETATSLKIDSSTSNSVRRSTPL